MEPTTALQFSGGKDSRVILHMHREQLDDILVVWTNTGASYPAVIEQMAELSHTVPHFLEVKSNQPEYVEKYGYPSDVIPLHYTPMGRGSVKSTHTFRIQDAFSCCAGNLWIPMHKAMVERGITKIIRGQRNSEQYTAPIRNGHVENGIEYVFPIEDWTEQQVFAYLKENNVPAPAYYSTENTSHDCWSCTAYLDHGVNRIRNLPDEQRTEVMRRLTEIELAIEAQSAPRHVLLYGRQHAENAHV